MIAGQSLLHNAIATGLKDKFVRIILQHDINVNLQDEKVSEWVGVRVGCGGVWVCVRLFNNLSSLGMSEWEQ